MDTAGIYGHGGTVSMVVVGMQQRTQQPLILQKIMLSRRTSLFWLRTATKPIQKNKPPQPCLLV
eukprot:scaffold12573_cov73-Skeletonema_marinoi.AAC.1